MTSQTSELVERLRENARDMEAHGFAIYARPLNEAATLLERLSSSEVTEEEVERVARAIYAALDDDVDSNWVEAEFGDGTSVYIDGQFDLMKVARSAITAMRSAATSERKG